MSDSGTEDRASRWPGAGAEAAGATRLAHYPGEGPAPLIGGPGAAPERQHTETPYPGDLDELFERLVDKWKAARDHSNEWRKEAREDYDMVAGRQWEDEAVRVLNEKNRPVITFNRTGPMVKIVCGLETGNRQEQRFIPREIGDAAVNDLITEAARWFRDQCDAEDEESDAFQDDVITGMGWVGNELDYDEDPEGKVIIERIDPLEMFWDAAARKKNLADAKCLWRVKETSRKDAEELYPDIAPEDLHARWAAGAMDGGEPHDADEAPFYRPGPNARDDNTLPDKITLVEAQWCEYVTMHRIADPITGQSVLLTDEQMDTLNERMPAIMAMPSVRQRKRVYWRAMLGNKVLKVWPGPAEGGFTWKCMTGERDHNKGTFYGIVRAMVDPQRWANKWLSQSMHIMNTGAKGGILAETGAFPDIKTAEDDWAEPDAIVEVSDGALAAGKIIPRPQNAMPPGLADLLTLALSSIRDCTGINLELLGLVEHDQPGIVEYQRKQAGMTVLSGLFDGLRRYRKDQGQLLLWYITNFLSDGRLIRITGESQARYVPLLRQDGIARYDVIVDDTPTSPNQKEKVWATMIQMMPYLSKAPVPPQVYLELMKYSPLPESVTSKIEQIIKSTPPQPDPITIAAQGQAQMNAARARLTDAQTQKTQMETAVGSHQVQAENARTQLEAAKTAIQVDEIKAKIENLRADALLKMSQAGVTQHDAQTDRMLAVLDMLDTLVGWHTASTQGQQATQ